MSEKFQEGKSSQRQTLTGGAGRTLRKCLLRLRGTDPTWYQSQSPMLPLPHVQRSLSCSQGKDLTLIRREAMRLACVSHALDPEVFVERGYQVSRCTFSR